MSERRRGRLALAVLSLVTITLVATAAAPVFSADSGGGGSTGVDVGSEDPPDPVLELDVPASSIVLAVLVVALVGLVVQFARDPRETFVGILKMAAVAGAFAAVAFLVAETVELTRYVAQSEYNGSVGNVSLTDAPTQTDAGFGDGSDDSFPIPTGRAVVVLVGAGVAGVLTVLLWRSGAVQSALGLRADEADGTDPSLEAIGDVAGEAADRVEAATTATAADNAIYGAWTEMVELLGVSDPRSDTPRAFERAAIDAGMDPDDVTVLTRTFESVRYGDATLSDERRDRVSDAFRRIEHSFGDDADPLADEAADSADPLADEAADSADEDTREGEQ